MTSATAELKKALEQVGKMLALEEKQGYHDRAVIGGIAPFARQHLATLRGSLPSRSADDTLARIDGLLRDYGSLSPAARAPRLSAALADLRQLYRQVNQVGENDPTRPRLTCPYHGWVYDLDGSRVARPYAEEAFADVAARYAGSAGADATLVAKLRTGGAGVWGATC